MFPPRPLYHVWYCEGHYVAFHALNDKVEEARWVHAHLRAIRVSNPHPRLLDDLVLERMYKLPSPPERTPM